MNKGVEKILDIFRDRRGFRQTWEDCDKDIQDEIRKELEQFLDKWEEEMVEANREAIEEQALENQEPAYDMHELD